MQNHQPLTYLLLILLLSSTCAEKKPVETSPHLGQAIGQSITDTLPFTSGIRAILHDSKGNYWFGSHRNGVCKYDGVSFQYFTAADGLSTNQVRTIQEHENGTIWFGSSNGVSSYDGEKIIDHNDAIKDETASNSKQSKSDISFNETSFERRF